MGAGQGQLEQVMDQGHQAQAWPPQQRKAAVGGGDVKVQLQSRQLPRQEPGLETQALFRPVQPRGRDLDIGTVTGLSVWMRRRGHGQAHWLVAQFSQCSFHRQHLAGNA